jgi:VWFA-related protein
MKSLYRLLIIFTLLISSARTDHPVMAQDEAVSLHLDWVDTTAFPTVSVHLSAWDADGLPLVDLGPEDFSLQEDGGTLFHPQSVQADREAALLVTLVLDVSESMTGEPLDDAQEAAARFLDRLTQGDRAAVIAFSDQIDPDPATLNPDLELDFSADLDPVYDLVEDLEAGGQTHLYNAAAKAVGLFASMPEGHRAVLLLTDGRNDPPEVGDPDEAIQQARDANLPFFVIGLGRAVDEPYLRRLASETGGLFRAAPSSSELAHLFTEMANLLKTQYVLTYDSQLTGDGEVHALDVILNAAGGSATDRVEFGPLPMAPPTETVTPPPLTDTPASTPTAIPPSATEPPTPKATQPPPTPTATPVPSAIAFIEDTPWSRLLALVLVLSVGGALLLSRRRKSRPTPEACAKCGYDLTGKTGACPQCGETRRLPKLKSR